jgi:predicted GNAT superfamily acetyltransferase
MSDITIHPLHTLDEFYRCVAIAREVWADAELDTEPHVTYVIAVHTGGQVLGAFDADTMVGFTKAFVGVHDHTPYLHSHMAAVLPSHRNRRIGRLLKLFQREDALRRGIRLIEWTFDPLETKNAHFNLNRLGAFSRRYIPNFYGVTTSPLHRGMPTDRLLVEWYLDSPRVIAAINNLTPEPKDAPALIHLPNSTSPDPSTPFSGGSLARPDAGRDPSGRSTQRESTATTPFSPSSPLPHSLPVSPSSLLDLQSRLRSEFTHWFSKGYAATSIRFTSSGADYHLSPYSDF